MRKTQLVPFASVVLALGASALLVALPIAQAAQISTFDFNGARTRLVTSDALAGLYLCPNPIYLQPETDNNPQHSFSSPVVAGGQIYQYSYTAGNAGTANLWQLNIPQASNTSGYTCPTANTIVTPTNDPSLVASDTTFDPGLASESHGAITVSGQNLNQAKSVASPTIADGYVAIGVGKYLYSWPLTSSKSHGLKKYIYGVDDINQVDDAPLITPPLPGTGTNANGLSVPFTSPYAVVGSWNGGLVAYPIDPPSGVTVHTTKWDTGSADATITSSPAWNGHDSLAYFGVSTTYSDTQSPKIEEQDGLTPSEAPRVIAWNPVDGATSRVIGGLGTYPNQIRYSVDSSVVAGPSGDIYVPDQQGDIYKYSPSGALLAFSGAGFEAGGDDISNLALSPTGVYASGNDLTTLYKLNPSTLRPEWADSNLGSNMYSPSIIEAGGRDEIFVSAGTHLYGISGSNQRYSTTTFETAPYAAIVPDAGTGTGPRYFLSWVDSDPNGYGAIVAWVALPYHLRASLLPLGGEGSIGETPTPGGAIASVPANDGDDLAITARTPSLSTQIIAAQWATEPNTSAGYTTADDIGGPIALSTINQDGAAATAAEPYSIWQIGTALPEAIQAHPGIYYLDLTATARPGSSLSPLATGTTEIAKNAIEVEVTAPVGEPPTCSASCNQPPPPTGQGDLTFRAYGEYPRYPHPEGTARLGDSVHVELTVPESQIQLGSGEVLRSAYFTHVALTYPHGIVLYDGLKVDPISTKERIETRTRPMQIAQSITGISTQMTAKDVFIENWAGFPPPIPPATSVGTWQLSAEWTAYVAYTYQTHGEDCNEDGKDCQPETQTHYGHTDISGIADANITITGTDWYIIPVATQVGTE